MKQNKFFANVASKALTLAAAVVMMSAAFTACPKDSDNDNGGGTPEPEPKGKLTVNGVDTPIRMAEYLKESNGDYYLYLYFANDRKGRVKFELNKNLHMNGNSINLSKTEEWHSDGFYWKIDYTDSNNKDLIHASGSYHFPKLFEAGTLTVASDIDGTLDIKLENGSIVGADGNTYTIALNYNGPVTNKNVPLPTPKAGTVIIDGKEKTIHAAQYKHMGYNDYWIQLFLSDDHKERVELWLDTKAHIGHTTDLTKQEEALNIGHWQITYHDSKGNRLICACGTYEGPILFETGTLTMAGSIDGTLDIKLENGRIVGEDGKEYTLTLSYNDTMKKME